MNTYRCDAEFGPTADFANTSYPMTEYESTLLSLMFAAMAFRSAFDWNRWVKSDHFYL
jgi:hypothetical protein